VKRVCIYHAGCPDGFGAAWSVWRAWGDDADYVARGHDDPFRPESFADKLVVVVDISLDNRSLRGLGQVAGRIVLLDHHVSSKRHFDAEPSLARELAADGHLVHFDLAHSGAVLAWTHFHPGRPLPELLRYVEDQDLWSWKLPRSEEVNAAIGSYPRRYEVWDELATRPIEALAAEGEPIVRAHQSDVRRLLRTAHPVAIGTKRIEAVNSPVLRSAVGHELAVRATFGAPWGMLYRVLDDRVDVSLYSIGELDVSAVARGYGGGGHRNAAGFSVRLRDWLDHFVLGGGTD
jgi:hypothetical protein